MHLFRLAGLSDAQAIMSLYKNVRELGREDGSCDWDDDYPSREMTDEDIAARRLFVLQEDGDIIAAVSLLEEDDLDAEPVGWAEVDYRIPVRLCVAPWRRGEGLGEALMRKLEDHARRQGCRAFRLIASASNPAALRLWEGLGYRFKDRVSMYGKVYRAYEKLL